MNEGDDATLPDTRGGLTDPVPRVSAVDLGERYEVGPLLGRGGMGEVRLARDLRIDREVAVKLMHGAHRDELTLGRFFREARVQGVLEHPAVVPVHDLGIDRDGNPYFVMKKLSGMSLQEVLTSKDPSVAERWPRRTLLARLIDVCLAVEFAHSRGVIHRDIKPANIMIGDYGEAYVLDWGLAKVSAEGESFRGVAPLSGDDIGHTLVGDLLGTPGYMSPEQARGEAVDWRTDVFGLGCVLYEILTGFSAMPRGIAALAISVGAPHHRPSERTSDIPPELDDLCVRATVANAADRPTARELAAGLQAYLDGDRDDARRRELADEAVATAREAARRPGDEGRAIAMRSASSALALDPSHQGAQEVLGSLLFDIPDTLPAEAVAAADQERGEVRQRVIRKAGFTYLFSIFVLAGTFVLDVRQVWPIVLGIVLCATTSTYAFLLARRPMPMASPWFIGFTLVNCATVSTTGLIFGVLLMLPMFVIGSLSAFLSLPTRHSPWTIIGIHLLPMGVLLTLELTGILPRSFDISAGTLVITPYALGITPLSLALVFGSSFLVQLGSTIDLQSGFRVAQEAAQNRIHAQTWHLKQLLPREGTLETGRTPKV
ncbi:MAG: serine/threonine protein kinase [Myxococcales bacterium]|nr:serine/threonine protein kinase [Myxococcales bacterium]